MHVTVKWRMTCDIMKSSEGKRNCLPILLFWKNLAGFSTTQPARPPAVNFRPERCLHRAGAWSAVYCPKLIVCTCTNASCQTLCDRTPVANSSFPVAVLLEQDRANNITSTIVVICQVPTACSMAVTVKCQVVRKLFTSDWEFELLERNPYRSKVNIGTWHGNGNQNVLFSTVSSFTSKYNEAPISGRFMASMGYRKLNGVS